MQTQKIFQTGNSSAVTIPKYLLQELNLSTGSEVVVDKAPDGQSLVIRKKGRAKKSAEDFKLWLDTFLEENSEILDELAIR